MEYRLLIVDDEEWIRKGFIARLAYLSLEFGAIYEAGSGTEGLGVLEENSVDIIVTDIRMPDMDGLTFISRARQWYPDIRFLILSGYAEFCYAKQAISLGASAYLLKPLSNEELKKSMLDVFSRLKEEKRMKAAAFSGERLQKEKEAGQFEKELNLLLQSPVSQLPAALPDALLPEAQLPAVQLPADQLPAAQLPAAQFPAGEKGNGGREGLGRSGAASALSRICPWITDIRRGVCFYTGVFSFEQRSVQESGWRREDLELARFIVKNVFLELPGACRKTIAADDTDSMNMLAVFRIRQDRDFCAEAEALYFKISGVLEQILSMGISLGVSGPCGRPGRKGKEEGMEALKQRMICGQPGIYFYEDVIALEEVPVPGVQLHMLRYFMEKNDLENIRSCIHKILAEEAAGKHRGAYLNMVWIRILSMALSVMHERKGENPRKVRTLLGGFKEFDAMHSLEEIERKLTEVVGMSLAGDREEEGCTADKIRMAAAYIRENFNTPISVNWLAERFGMSPNYFSTMFKKETGKSAGSYITGLRIEKAREMLTFGDQPAADIARETGYDDAQYFFRVFKRETGQTPIQYRFRVREEINPDGK